MVVGELPDHDATCIKVFNVIWIDLGDFGDDKVTTPCFAFFGLAFSNQLVNLLSYLTIFHIHHAKVGSRTPNTYDNIKTKKISVTDMTRNQNPQF